MDYRGCGAGCGLEAGDQGVIEVAHTGSVLEMGESMFVGFGGGGVLFVAEGGTAPDKPVARYLQQRAQMMSKFHNKVAATHLVQFGEQVIQKTSEGRLVGVFPIDYLLWTSEAAGIAQEMKAGMAADPELKTAELWFEGRVSQQARAGLEAQGWAVKESAGLLLVEQEQQQ